MYYVYSLNHFESIFIDDVKECFNFIGMLAVTHTLVWLECVRRLGVGNLRMVIIVVQVAALPLEVCTASAEPPEQMPAVPLMCQSNHTPGLQANPVSLYQVFSQDQVDLVPISNCGVEWVGPRWNAAQIGMHRKAIDTVQDSAPCVGKPVTTHSLWVQSSLLQPFYLS